MSDSQQIDRVCDEFEAEWRAGRRPQIEAFLSRMEPSNQAELLRELLDLEVEYRLRGGERPLYAEYTQRFPANAEVIGAVFTKQPIDPRKMPSHIFVSYSTDDRPAADQVCSLLETNGLRCWIAPRDIPPGEEFEKALLSAIDLCDAMVLVLSPSSNQSPFVKNEVNRAFSKGKTIFTLRLVDMMPSDALAFYLARHQWTDCFPPPFDAKINRLGKAIRALAEQRLRGSERSFNTEQAQRIPGRTDVSGAVNTKPQPVATATATRRDGGAPALTLTITEGPYKGRTFTFAGHDLFLVGRSKQTQLAINDGYFSRFHFMIEMNPPQCRLTDMGSRNGTQVNGQRVQTIDLTDGAVIKAGHTTLIVSIPVQSAEQPSSVISEAPTLGLPAAAARVAATDSPSSPVAEAQTLSLSGVALPAAAVSAKPVPLKTLPETLPASAAAQPMVAPSVPGYRILRELGHGGMGVVYLAEPEAGGAPVALKTVIPAVAANPVQMARFLREANILRQLQHPNIVSCREVGGSNEQLYFAMDYVEGTDASKMLKQQGRLAPKLAVRMLIQLLSALEYAHEKGFVHRDIKPANLLVAEQGGKKVVKFADFGLARVYQESRMSGLTMQGDVGGTLAFMAPEQITQFREVKPTADQYSAAATLYNLLTGRFFFDFTPGTAPALSTILQEEPVPIRQRRPELAEELALVIHRALAKDPAKRFPDVRAFRAALKAFA